MNLFHLMLIGGITLAGAAYAEGDVAATGAAEAANEEKIIKATVNKEKVNLYNFSADLIKAAEECSAYSEDFSQNNPEVKEQMAEMFGNADLSVPIEILGLEGDLCHFTVGYKMSGIGGSKYDCKLNAEQKAELLEAMQDRSTDLVTETFTTAATSPTDMPVETTMTAGKFDVVLSKLQATACKLEEMLPSREETEEAQRQFQQLPNEFIAALPNCESMEISRRVVFFEEKTSIVGWNGDKCHISYNGFDLNVPPAELNNILTYDDLDRLSENPEISTYDYKQNYNYEYLMFTLQNCSANTGAPNHIYSNRTSGIVETKNGIEALYKDDTCNLTFVNEVTIKGDKKDYSVVCAVPGTIITEILEPYKPLLEAYADNVAANDNGSMHSTSGLKSDDTTKIADGRIMYDLQIRGLCQMKEAQE